MIYYHMWRRVFPASVVTIKQQFNQTTFSIRGRPNSSTPALSSYSIQCLNERTKTSTLPSQITGKYELDFPDSSSKRDNTLRNKLAAHLQTNQPDLVKYLIHLQICLKIDQV